MARDERKSSILSTIGVDRLGIVAAATMFLRDRNANVEASYAVRLGAMFLLHLLFSATRRDMVRIRAELEAALAGMLPTIVPARVGTTDRDAEAYHFALRIFAYDHVGLVADVTALITQQGGDIVALAGAVYPSPFNGTPLFVTEMRIDLPNLVAVRHTRRALFNLENERGYDIDIQPEPSTDLATDPMKAFPPSRWAEVRSMPPHESPPPQIDQN